MKEIKNVGIWMDHSHAEIIDASKETAGSTIDSKFTYDTMREAAYKSEHIRHNKEQQLHEEFYKEIGSTIVKYDHVLLFGPTTAKSELRNYLKKDLHFENINIDVLPADKMTDNEKAAFVRNHFEE